MAIQVTRVTPAIGALGVRMIDGNGDFLRESYRGFPSPWVAFCKMAGLTTLFPHSRLFAGYYLGHLPPDKPHPAPVLSGACLWVRRAILDTEDGLRVMRAWGTSAQTSISAPSAGPSR